MVPRRDADDVVDAGVDPLHQPTCGPSRSQHGDPRFLRGRGCGTQAEDGLGGGRLGGDRGEVEFRG